MKKFFAILLFRFFPDNSWLRKYWWHRLALIIAGSITTFGLIISIFLIYVFVGQLKDYLIPFDPIKEGGIPITQTMEGRIVGNVNNSGLSSADIFKMDQISGLGDQYASNEEFIKKAFKSGLTQAEVRSAVAERNRRLNYRIPSIDWSTLVWIIIWLFVAYLIPSGIYRVILFVLTDNKWRNEPRK